MLRVSVSELKNRLSHYMRLVKRGETIEIMDRSVPVALLQGISGKPLNQGAHVKRLLRDGIVSPGRSAPSREVLKKAPIPCQVDPVRVLIEERGDR